MNRRELLEWTLRSVRGQTYPNIEHIVVDGGSTDGTIELLRAYEPTYRLSWVSEPDSGMYEGINKGFARANGEILAYLNSDDLYFPWTLETVVAGFVAHSEADLVHGDVLVVDDDTGKQHLGWQYPFDLDFVRRVGFMAQPGIFWRRKVFEDAGPFDTSLRFVADCDYWMRVGEHHRFVKLNEFLAVERDHRSTLREENESRLHQEIDLVRRRYVSLEGPDHVRRARRHLRRTQLLWRLYWAAFIIQTMVPSRLRRGRWARFLKAKGARVYRIRGWLSLLPKMGRAFRGRVTAPDRRWLEPAG